MILTAHKYSDTDHCAISLNNCGTGAGGFKPGNKCAKGGTGGVRLEGKGSKKKKIRWGRVALAGVGVVAVGGAAYLAYRSGLMNPHTMQDKLNLEEYGRQIWGNNPTCNAACPDRPYGVLEGEPRKDDIEFMDRSAKTLLDNPEATHQDFLRLAGAQSTSSSTFHLSDNQAIVYVQDSGFASERTIRRSRHTGILVLENDYLEIYVQNQGLGTKILYQQVEACQAFGIKEITCVADRTHPGASISGKINIGYKVWPRLGYDGYHGLTTLFDGESPIVKYAIKHDLWKIRDFMKNKEHRDWWDTNGDTFKAVFDTDPNGESFQILKAAYERAKVKYGS